MKFQFKQALHLHGHDYKLGAHEVPEKVLQDPRFHKYIKLGLVVEVDPKIIPLSHEEKGKETIAKILAGAKQKLVSEDPPPEDEDLQDEEEEIVDDGTDESSGEELGEEEPVETESESKGKKKKNKNKNKR